MDQFKKDLKSPETAQRVQKDIKSAQDADVTGTPSIFINGHRVEQRSPENIQKIIDAELNK
jgi:protein-disulfide isomerase